MIPTTKRIHIAPKLFCTNLLTDVIFDLQKPVIFSCICHIFKVVTQGSVNNYFVYAFVYASKNLGLRRFVYLQTILF